jgi:hypothetical protein
LPQLVLYEFINMLVRISFWRANPRFGLWVDKDGDGVKDKEAFVPVPQALSKMLNDLVLPTAKRENSAEFRTKEMREQSVRQAISTYRPKLKAWFIELQQSAISVDGDDNLGFDEWLKALRHPHESCAERPHVDLCGEWEIEQLSEITADPSAHSVHIKCRLSVPTCKAAFMDSQRAEQLGVGQAAANSAQTVLTFVSLEGPEPGFSHALLKDLRSSLCAMAGRVLRMHRSVRHLQIHGREADGQRGEDHKLCPELAGRDERGRLHAPGDNNSCRAVRREQVTAAVQ